MNVDENQQTENHDVKAQELGQAEAQELDAQDVNAESSTASDGHDKNQTSNFQDRINKVTAQKYAEKKRADELEAELEAMKANAGKPSVSPDLVAPQLPDDLYDDDAMRKYHTEMSEYSRKLAESAAVNAYEMQQQNNAQKAQQQQANETFQAYAANALKAGVSEEKIIASGTALNNAGISPELGDYIMRDPNGGQIAAFLHDNEALMYEVINMSPTQAAVKIATEIKPQAISTTPKVTKAPDPIPDIQASGVEPKDDFESKYPNTQFI